MRVLSLAEAAETTGLSRKALARRIERGSLRSVLRDGQRYIPLSELERAGLLPDAELRALRAEVDSLRAEVAAHRQLVESTEKARLAEVEARERLQAEAMEARAQETEAREKLDALISASWWRRRRLLRRLAHAPAQVGATVPGKNNAQ